jgi:hypothetical protein
MPKIFLIVWFKIDQKIYLLTNKNQENREEEKGIRFHPSLFSQLFIHLVSFSLQCLVCALLYCVLTVLCQVALTYACMM